MAKLNVRLNIYSPGRIDVPEIRELFNEQHSLPQFKVKSYQEILKEMICSFSVNSNTGITDIRPGTVLCTLLETMAEQVFVMNQQFAQMMQSMAQQYYTYPDGSKGTSKPRDGEKYAVYSPTDGSTTDWQYDGMLDKWVAKNILRPRGHTPSSEIESATSLSDEMNSALKCECGSEAAGSPRHSSWCKKFNPDV